MDDQALAEPLTPHTKEILGFPPDRPVLPPGEAPIPLSPEEEQSLGAGAWASLQNVIDEIAHETFEEASKSSTVLGQIAGAARGASNASARELSGILFPEDAARDNMEKGKEASMIGFSKLVSGTLSVGKDIVVSAAERVGVTGDSLQETREWAGNTVKKQVEFVGQVADPYLGFVKGAVQRTQRIVTQVVPSASSSITQVATEDEYVGLLQQEHATELTVPRGSRHTAPYYLPKGASLQWEFMVKDYDIGFGLKQRVQELGGATEKYLVNSKRYEAGFVHAGQFNTEGEPVHAVLEWDNSFSRFRQKCIAYRALVIKEPVPEYIDLLNTGPTTEDIHDLISSFNQNTNINDNQQNKISTDIQPEAPSTKSDQDPDVKLVAATTVDGTLAENKISTETQPEAPSTKSDQDSHAKLVAATTVDGTLEENKISTETQPEAPSTKPDQDAHAKLVAATTLDGTLEEEGSTTLDEVETQNTKQTETEQDLEVKLKKEAEEQAAATKLAEEQAAKEKFLQEQAAAKRISDEQAAAKRMAEEQAAAKRIAEEQAALIKKKADEDAATAKRLADEQAVAAKKLAEEQAAAARLLQEQAAAKRLAEEQAAAKRIAEEQAAAKRFFEMEAARKLQEQQAAAKKLEEERLAKEKAEAEIVRQKAEAERLKEMARKAQQEAEKLINSEALEQKQRELEEQPNLGQTEKTSTDKINEGSEDPGRDSLDENMKDFFKNPLEESPKKTTDLDLISDQRESGTGMKTASQAIAPSPASSSSGPWDQLLQQNISSKTKKKPKAPETKDA